MKFYALIPMLNFHVIGTRLRCLCQGQFIVSLLAVLFLTLRQHFLRGEPGVYYQDLYPLISFLPRYAPGAQSEADMLPLWSASEDELHPLRTAPTSGASTPRRTASDPGQTGDDTLNGNDEKSERSWFPSLGRKGSRPLNRSKTFDPEKALASVPVHRPLRPARNPPKTTFNDYFPIIRIFKWFVKKAFRGSNSARPSIHRKRKPDALDSNVPFEITLFLSK